MTNHLTRSVYNSPMGPLTLLTKGDTLHMLEFTDADARISKHEAKHFKGRDIRDSKTPAAVTRALDAYFKGDITAIDSLAVSQEGTDFQLRIWQALRDIPAGETRSYGDLAKAVGSPGSSRAVGQANHNNPIAIVVPCHRVIGASGTLTGYGGGLQRKEWLLRHEGVTLL